MYVFMMPCDALASHPECILTASVIGLGIHSNLDKVLTEDEWMNDEMEG